VVSWWCVEDAALSLLTSTNSLLFCFGAIPGALVDDVSKSATSTLIYAVDAQKSDIVSYLLANGNLFRMARHTRHDTRHTRLLTLSGIGTAYQAPM
jgi:hypothetical protein